MIIKDWQSCKACLEEAHLQEVRQLGIIWQSHLLSGIHIPSYLSHSFFP